MEVLLEGDGEALTRKAVEMALAGDTTALRLCMDRLIPVRKDRHIVFDIPKLETTADLYQSRVCARGGGSTGQMTPSEAGELSKMVKGFAKAVDLHDIQQRLTSSKRHRTGQGDEPGQSQPGEAPGN